MAVAKRSTKLRRPIYVIAITNQPEIKALLEYVGPWLVGKRPQGDLMLQYINDAPSRKRGPVSKDRRRSVPTGRYTEKHYEYVKQMKALNRRYAPGEWQDDEPEAPRSQDVFLPTTPDERLDDAIKRWWRLRTGTA